MKLLKMAILANTLSASALTLLGCIAPVRSQPVRSSLTLHRQDAITMDFYVPIRGKLVKKPLTGKMRSDSMAFGNKVIVLNEVIRLSPRYFPPGAKVLSVSQTNWYNKATKNSYAFYPLTLNKAFLNNSFWKKRGKQNTLFAFHALARNIAFTNDGKGIPLPVLFVVKGKRVTKIGSFIIKYHLVPDKILESVRPTYKYVYSLNARKYRK